MRTRRAEGMRVYVDGAPRQREDGYACQLVPGLRSSMDAQRLAKEIAFASTRLLELQTLPKGPYAQASSLMQTGELEQASMLCFLIAYLCPTEGEQPFTGIEEAFAAIEKDAVEALDLDALPLGPRSSYRRGEGLRTVNAYRTWVARSGSQAKAFSGDPDWAPQRRFARAFERLAIPGFSRGGRFELLTLLGALGLYELEADSLHVSAVSGPGAGGSSGHADATEPVLAACKRVFGIGDAINIERRASGLAEACGAPLGALDLALFNWSTPSPLTRATLGMRHDLDDGDALEAASSALGV